MFVRFHVSPCPSLSLKYLQAWISPYFGSGGQQAGTGRHSQEREGANIDSMSSYEAATIQRAMVRVGALDETKIEFEEGIDEPLQRRWSSWRQAEIMV